MAAEVAYVVRKGNHCIRKAKTRPGESISTYMLGENTALRIPSKVRVHH